MPRPDLFKLFMLEPNLFTYRRALDKIIVLFRVFDRYSKDYRVNYYDIRPVFDNFKITYLITGEDLYIEDKISYCRIEQTIEIESLSLQHL